MAIGINLDLFGALEKLIQWHQIGKWITLGIELLCSFWLSAAFAGGSALTVHRPPWEALGIGLCSGATMATIIWRRSPLTKGLMLALPGDEAKQELAGGEQVIQK